MKAVKPAVVRSPRIVVSALNLNKAAARLLSTKLVSTEIDYLQRTLSASTTQIELDTQVMAVRRMPWASIVTPE
ncbi:MAG TPA: hypothetical protein VF824_22365 [Thermoanaerobaculia bacterium]|jgi:hypothetical protein